MQEKLNGTKVSAHSISRLAEVFGSPGFELRGWRVGFAFKEEKKNKNDFIQQVL